MNELKNAYTILFVEDEKEIRQNYVIYLKKYFMDVYEAADGVMAYEIYKSKKPDIMIVDINLPKLNGIEFLKKVRELDHTTKAIMLTAHADVNYLLEATSLKLTKYLIKPISRNDLKEALNLAITELDKYEVSSKKILFLKDGYSWNYKTQELKGQYSIALTDKERQLLQLFFSNVNIIYSYDDIIITIWNDYEGDKISALKTIIKNLRKKLPKDTIKNIFGVGYKIEL
ncbi:MAG: response regulator transcription factor [Sulfurimonas sp.]|uniref:response regulator transcription factor n=1 Tax=Sulfurimonas sp. TaxID=2022749 RepID=UPI0025D9B160|nr:response regulator transcription factor [Sulfurimonas sp.]MCK9491470.1 response regulator transcription factor [Sulfurimonas sp.]